MRGQEALGVSHRLEASHPPFSVASGLVRVLGAVVHSPCAMMSDLRHDILFCSTVARKLIGHDHTGQIPKSLKQLSEEPRRRLGVAALLYQDVEDFSALIHRAPQLDELAVDLAEHFVEMPCVAVATDSSS